MLPNIPPRGHLPATYSRAIRVLQDHFNQVLGRFSLGPAQPDLKGRKVGRVRRSVGWTAEAQGFHRSPVKLRFGEKVEAAWVAGCLELASVDVLDNCTPLNDNYTVYTYIYIYICQTLDVMNPFTKPWSFHDRHPDPPGRSGPPCALR